MEKEQRLRAAVAVETAKYLSYVEEHKTDDGFSTGGTGKLNDLRSAVVNSNFVRKNAGGLELTQKGFDFLRSARLVGAFPD